MRDGRIRSVAPDAECVRTQQRAVAVRAWRVAGAVRAGGADAAAADREPGGMRMGRGASMHVEPSEGDASLSHLGANVRTSATSRAARSLPHVGVGRQHDCMLNQSSQEWGGNAHCLCCFLNTLSCQ